MKEKINNFIKTIFNRKELIVSISSLFISFLYTIYNMIIVILNYSIFNGIISIYYLLLTICNSILIYRIYRTKKSEKPYKIMYIFIYIYRRVAFHNFNTYGVTLFILEDEIRHFCLIIFIINRDINS